MNDVSIVIPARNASATIEETLRSIVDQPHLRDVVIVDDGSEDGTGDVAKRLGDPRLRVLRTDGLGISGALNLGFEAAEGAFIARCDADDVYLPGRLDWQRRFLLENPDAAAISAGFRTMTEAGGPIMDLACEGEPRDVTQLLLQGETVTHFGTWLTRAEAIRASGGARTWFLTAEDLDLQFRLAASGSVWHWPTAVYGYRLREGSIMHTGSRALHDFYEKRARGFARQRAATGRDDLERGSPPPIPEDLRNASAQRARRHIANHLESQAWQLFNRDGFGTALPWMLRAVRHSPADLRKWRGLAIMLIKGLRPS
jgi:glycosyltransferase involved in cell wall biosynthesis